MTSSSSSSKPVPGDPAGHRDAPSPASDRVSPLRVAVWVAIAIVLVTGIVLYFRHQDEVVPVLGVAAEANSR